MFYQCLELSIEGSKDEMPPFIIDCYDFDKNTFSADSADFLCRCIIPVKDAAVLFVKEKDDDKGKAA